MYWVEITRPCTLVLAHELAESGDRRRGEDVPARGARGSRRCFLGAQHDIDGACAIYMQPGSTMMLVVIGRSRSKVELWSCGED